MDKKPSARSRQHTADSLSRDGKVSATSSQPRRLFPRDALYAPLAAYRQSPGQLAGAPSLSAVSIYVRNMTHVPSSLKEASLTRFVRHVSLHHHISSSGGGRSWDPNAEQTAASATGGGGGGGGITTVPAFLRKQVTLVSTTPLQQESTTSTWKRPPLSRAECRKFGFFSSPAENRKRKQQWRRKRKRKGTRKVAAKDQQRESLSPDFWDRCHCAWWEYYCQKQTQNNANDAFCWIGAKLAVPVEGDSRKYCYVVGQTPTAWRVVDAATGNSKKTVSSVVRSLALDSPNVALVPYRQES